MTSAVGDSGWVLGIDAGYSASRPTTGVCVLWWQGGRVGWSCNRTTSDEAGRLASLNALVPPQIPGPFALAIDGPLRPLLAVDSGNYRSAESLLSRGKFQTRGKPGQTHAGSGPRLHAEATAIAEMVMRAFPIAASTHRVAIHERAIVEAFPNLFLGVLCHDLHYPACAKRRKWTDSLYRPCVGSIERMLSGWFTDLDVTGSLDITGHEEIAAFICALTAAAVVVSDYTAVGSAADGWITLPGSSHWGGGGDENAIPWARRELELNLKSVGLLFPGASVIWSD